MDIRSGSSKKERRSARLCAASTHSPFGRCHIFLGTKSLAHSRASYWISRTSVNCRGNLFHLLTAQGYCNKQEKGDRLCSSTKIAAFMLNIWKPSSFPSHVKLFILRRTQIPPISTNVCIVALGFIVYHVIAKLNEFFAVRYFSLRLRVSHFNIEPFMQVYSEGTKHLKWGRQVTAINPRAGGPLYKY